MPTQFLSRLGCDDQLAAPLTRLRDRRPGGEHNYGERHSLVGKKLAHPSIVLCQLDEIASRHQPSCQPRSERYILCHHQDAVSHEIPTVPRPPRGPRSPAILHRCYIGDISGLPDFAMLASARQSTDGPDPKGR